MIQHRLLARLLRYDFDALEDLRVASRDLEDYADTAWEFLKQAGAQGEHVVAGFCRAAVECLIRAYGQGKTEQLIADEWPRLSDWARSSISYDAMSYPDLLSASLGRALFFSKSSSVTDRLDIAFNLFNTRASRMVEPTWLSEMVEMLRQTADAQHRERANTLAREVRIG